MRGPVIAKLGGSVITDKSVPFSYKERVVRALGRAIASSRRHVVVVHGGGSFGHPLARRFGLSSRASSVSSRGVGETRAAMFRLDSNVCDSLSSVGVNPYPFSPFTLLESEGDAGLGFITRLLEAGATPVTFGDVVHDGKGFRVLSGDTICVELSEMLGAPLCVMAMDVEGVLDAKGRVIKVLGGGGADLPPSQADATGGIGLKLREAKRMASSGTEVRFVSGLRPAEFAKALRGVGFHGTSVKVPPGVSKG